MATNPISSHVTNNDIQNTNFLDPSHNPKRIRLNSEEADDGFEDNDNDTTNENNSGEFNSNDFDASFAELNSKYRPTQTKSELIKSYLLIAIEGDLAGFQIAWVMMSVGFIFMKIFHITDVVQTIQWWAIFVIPFINAVLTAWFDHIIRRFRSTKTIESLKKARFVVLWAIKIVFVIYVTTYWVWGRGSFLVRFRELKDFRENPKACTGQILCVYIGVLAASGMSEVMITTVLINSEQNLSVTRTPMGYRFILLIIRPFVWVYNRTMVMFLCFYAIYGLIYTLFLVGWMCDFMCASFHCQESQKVGLKMLVVPFTHPSYLLNIDQIFLGWDDIPDEDFLETFVTVFLCQSFYVDCLNSLWQFSRRYLKPTRSLESNDTVRGLPPSPKDKRFLSNLAKELPPSTPLSKDGKTMPQSLEFETQLASRSSLNYNTVALK